MKPAPSLPYSAKPPEPIAWMLQNRAEAGAILVGLAGISLVFILHLWIAHRRASLVKKFTWSLILCLPLLGWLFYLALFTPPGYSDSPLNVTGDAGAGPGDHP